MSNVHRFDASRAAGERGVDKRFMEAVCRKAFPGHAGLIWNTRVNAAQYLGIDLVVVLSSGAKISIDVKCRGREFNDVLLEDLSDAARRTPGWMNKDLQIDFLAYCFQDSLRCYLFPWPTLRRVWLANRRSWFGEVPNNLPWARTEKGWKKRGNNGFWKIAARNPTYTTLSLAVPIRVLRAAISDADLIDVSAELSAKSG